MRKIKIGDLRHNCLECGKLEASYFGYSRGWGVYVCNFRHDTALCDINELADVEIEDYLNMFIAHRRNGCFVKDCDYDGMCKSCLAKKIASKIKTVSHTRKAIKEFEERNMGILYYDVINKLQKLKYYEEMDAKGRLVIYPCVYGERFYMLDIVEYRNSGAEKLILTHVTGIDMENEGLLGLSDGYVDLFCDYYGDSWRIGIDDLENNTIPYTTVSSMDEAEKIFEEIKKTENYKTMLLELNDPTIRFNRTREIYG